MTVKSKYLAKSFLLSASFVALTTSAMTQENKKDDSTQNQGAVLDTVVITGTSIATDIKNAPASISVVSQDKIQQRGGPDLTEALRTVPGLNVGFGSDGTRGISMRGMGSGYTLILIDGKRVNSGLTTMRHYNGDLDWVPVDAIDRIEVVRGPMSTLYGSDAMGGVVNIITKKAQNQWTGSLTTEWIQPESNRTGVTKKIGGHISGPIVPDILTFSAFANVSEQKPGEPRRTDDLSLPRGTDDYDFDSKFTWTPTPDQSFDFQLGRGKEKYKPYLKDGAVDTSATYIRRSTASVSHTGEWRFGTTTFNAYIERAENNHNNEDKSGNLSNSTIQVDTITVDGKVSMPIDLLFQQDLTIGGEYRHEKMVDPDNLGKKNELLNTDGSPEAKVYTAAVFLEDQIHITEQLKLTGGIRVDEHEEFGTHASPRVYVNYDITDSWSIKTGWAQAFKAPNLRQLNPNWVTGSKGRGCGAAPKPCVMVGNPDLQPETSNSYEFGLYHTSVLWEGSLTYFYNEFEDKITSARTASAILPPSSPGGKPRYYVQQINVDRARTQGLEGGITLYPHQDWTWSNSFTYLIESKNLETGMPLSADPEYSIHTELTWQATEELSLTGSWDFYGKQVDYVKKPETFVAQNVSAYNVAGISFKYDPSKNFTLRAGVNNLFDQQPDTESNYGENGRSYFVSLTSRF